MNDQNLSPGPHVMVTATKQPVLIWSGEWRAWWGPNRSRYYSDLASAGRYTLTEAIHATHHCGPEKMIRIEDAPDLPVDPRDAVVAAAETFLSALKEYGINLDNSWIATQYESLRAALKGLGG